MAKVKAYNPEEVLASYTFQKFKEAMLAKTSEATKWKKAFKAYDGILDTGARPAYKSDAYINFVFKTIETIRPIMVDNNPKFQAMAKTADGVDKSDIIQKALNYEWDREGMDKKLAKALIPNLVIGNAIFYLPWNPNKDKGQVECILVDPHNVYPDPLADNISNAEYVIYATYKHVNQLKKLFPSKAPELIGGDVVYSELVADRDRNASGIDNQVLVIEMWLRDYTTVDYEEKNTDGSSKMMKKRKYPNGRVVTTCPDLGLVLSDRPNPYNDGLFPFVQMKNYDVPFKFWGKGDVEQLMSPQKYLNEINNQIIDNARHTGNAQWVMDKNSGVPRGQITNRPGLVIRKNPGTEVRRESPPPMPSYIQDKILELKTDMETISGIHESVSGERPTGIQAGNAILALQEAGQTRIRMKVKLMEKALEELGNMWYSRMQQFWKQDRFIRVAKEEGGYDFDKVTREQLKLDYDIKVTAGSTMPNNKSAKLDLMIRLAQTPAEDGFPMVDRRAVLEFVDLKDKKGLIDRMEEMAGQGTLQQQLEQVIQQNDAEHQEIQSVLSDLAQNVKEISTAINNLEDKFDKTIQENKELKMKQDAEQSGYERGLKEIPPDLQDDERMAMEDMRNRNQQGDLAEQLRNGIIPDEVLDEIQNLPPDQLEALLNQYPQLEEMLMNQQ